MAVLRLLVRDDAALVSRTARRLDGMWLPWTALTGDILSDNPGTLSPEPVDFMTCAGTGPDFQVCVVNRGERGLLHALKGLTAPWTPYGDAAAAASAPGDDIRAVAAGENDGLFHLCIAVRPFGGGDIGLYHTIRGGGGRWRPFMNVGGNLRSVACAGVRPELHACGVTESSADPSQQPDRLVHALWRDSTGWTVLGDVGTVVLAQNPASLNPGPFRRVACARRGTDLDVFATAGSSLFSTTRRSTDGGWSAFRDVIADVRTARGGPTPTTVSDVSAVNVNGEVHLVLVDSNGAIFHTIRAQNGGWLFPFGNVRDAVPGGTPPGSVTRVAAADSF